MFKIKASEERGFLIYLQLILEGCPKWGVKMINPMSLASEGRPKDKSASSVKRDAGL